jgi:RimJ/RimL family protein N-acetyltransferase
VAEYASIRTDRLLLTALADEDLDELHSLRSDPAVWMHFPSGRFIERSQTQALIARYQEGWRQHGLDTWVARPLESAEPRPLLGIGGCSLRYDAAWNLYYRLTPTAWGHGYAQELIAAARAAATQVRPDLPIMVSLLEHNTGSRRAAERAGFELTWRGPDVGNPDSTAIRLIYADRPVDAAALAEFTDR